METQDRWLSKDEIARRFNCSPRSVDNWVRRGTFPAPDRLPNGRPAWRESVVLASVKQSA